MTTFKPSHYQEAVFFWVTNGRGDAVLQAVAGSGKTSTLVEASKLLHSSRATFLAFNNHIVRELQERLGKSMSCKTIHSVGMGAVRRHLGKAVVDEEKYNDIAKPYAAEIADDLKREYQLKMRQWARSRDEDDVEEPEEPPNVGIITRQLQQLAHYTRVTLTAVQDFEEVEEMVNHFNCLDDSLSLKMLHYPLQSILREGERIAADRGIIDYDDMLWLPWKWNLIPYQVGWVFCDEAQDFSPAILDLVLKMRGRGGRILFVADPKQAIMGFAGALNDSVDQIIKRTNATVLPLSICYRCPSKHIELAQKLVPTIEARPGAPEGVVEHIPYEKVSSMVCEGDLVISRCTAPAVKLCIELIAKRIPARVRGRDIGRALTAIVKEVAGHPEFRFKEFNKFLQEYQRLRIDKLMQRKNSESQIQSLRDRIDGIQVCYEAFNCNSIGEFCQEIEDLFSDGRASVLLSTVHRAKGLEEHRVFILRPDQLPLRWANQQDWEKEQEQNLVYVSLTRAKEALYFVTEDKPSKDESLAAEDEPEIEDEDEDEDNEY